MTLQDAGVSAGGPPPPVQQEHGGQGGGGGDHHPLLTWQYDAQDYESRMGALLKFVQKDMFNFVLNSTSVL